jgi:hypothetical protein
MFFRWLSIAKPFVRALTFAVPNGGRRDCAEAISLKAQGVTAGVPDIFMALPNERFSGLFIEFKHGKNKTTGLQDAFIARLREVGYCATICYSFDEAKEVVEEYLKGTDYD